MGKCSFGGDKILEFTVSVVFPEVSVGFWKGGICWIASSTGVATIPLLVVWRSSVVYFRDLECVGCSDLIVVLFLMFLLLLSLLTRFFFVGLSLEANGGFLLRE